MLHASSGLRCHFPGMTGNGPDDEHCSRCLHSANAKIGIRYVCVCVCGVQGLFIWPQNCRSSRYRQTDVLGDMRSPGTCALEARVVGAKAAVGFKKLTS